MISRGITARQSARSMAKLLGRSPSTVSREMSRNGGYDRYRATLADENAWARARRPKYCKLATNPRLRQAVAGKLRLDWSPEQIAGWLKRTHPEDGCNQVSHETIYRSLFVQTRGVLKKELLRHLRSRRTMRRSKPVDPNGDRRGHITDIISIRQRPAAVEDRAVPGHWEGDLLSGPNNSYIATLVERHTRYVMLAKVAGKDTQTVVSALIKQAKKLPKELYKSLTWDRGKELTDHRRFTLATNIDVYFCDPQSPWQRGSNENTNGLLRQYFPKGTDLSVHSQAITLRSGCRAYSSQRRCHRDPRNARDARRQAGDLCDSYCDGYQRRRHRDGSCHESRTARSKRHGIDFLYSTTQCKTTRIDQGSLSARCSRGGAFKSGQSREQTDHSSNAGRGHAVEVGI